MVERIVLRLPDVAKMQTAQLMLGGAYANMVALIESDDRYYVDLTAELVGKAGSTECYVVINGSGGEVWQSGVLSLDVGDVPDVDTEIEQRFPTVIEQMRQEMAAHDAAMEEAASETAQLVKDAEAAAERADGAVDKMPIIGENDNWWLWDAEKAEYADSGKPSGGMGGGAVDSVNGKTGEVKLTADDVGAVAADDLESAVNDALKQAKESGEFDGAQGEKGEAGADGVSCTHSWSGTVLTVTSASGSSSADLKGAQGEKGDPGAAGKNGSDGVGIKSVVQTTTSTADGGSNIITVTKTDGTTSTMTVRNGSKGGTGAQGERGEVGINWRGEWDGSETYAYRDAVRFNGSMYIYIDALGHAPEGSVPDTDIDVWELLVSKGAVGAAGSDGQPGADGAAGKDGSDGQRGTGILFITTAPSAYTTATGGFTPAYRVALSTVKTQSKAAEVLVGDIIAYSYYQYLVGYVDASYVYLGTRKSIRGATGTAGTTPVKGTDYFTAADKEEMVSSVKASLPKVTLTGTDENDVVHTWTLYGVQA